MLDYPVKILMAFGETFEPEGDEFYNWLLENGYPELAALSSGIKGSKEAIAWLMKNKFPQFAAFDGAIDKDVKAIGWLVKHKFDFLVVFADAINKKPEALKWLKSKDLGVFLRLAGKISAYGDKQSFDYHKLHF